MKRRSVTAAVLAQKTEMKERSGFISDPEMKLMITGKCQTFNLRKWRENFFPTAIGKFE